MVIVTIACKSFLIDEEVHCGAST